MALLQDSKRGSIPVNVVVRIRPSLRGEEGAQYNIVINGQKIALEEAGARHTESDEKAFSFIYGPEASSQDVFERSLLPILTNVVDGVNGCVVGFGESGSGKSFTLNGDGSIPGVTQLMVEGIFTMMREKEKTLAVGGKKNRGKTDFRWRIKMQALEIYNETLKDLFDPENEALALEENEDRGVYVRNLSTRWAETFEEFVELFMESRFHRTEEMTEIGPASERATTVLILELSQNRPASDEHDLISLSSKLVLVDMPGAERLGEDVATLRLREGPTMNRSLIAFGNMVNALSENADYVNYRESLLTFLLSDVFGGNTVTTVIATLKTGKIQPALTTLEYGAQMRRVRNYPIINDARVQGLLRKYRVAIMRLREELEVQKNSREIGGADGTDVGGQLLKIHELEGRIIQDNFDKIKLREEKEQIYEKLVEVRRKYNALVEAKAKLQEDLIASEEEKLRVSKALVDLKIQNSALEEDGETKNFELVNKVLSLENELVESELKNQNLQQVVEDTRTELDAAQREHRDLALEFVALKTNFMNVNKDLEREAQKNEELGVEFVNLVNAKEALVGEVEELRQSGGDLSNVVAGLRAQVREGNEARETLKTSADHARREADELRQQLNKAQIDLEQQLLVLETKKVEIERTNVEADKARASEIESLQKSRDHDIRRLENELAVTRDEVRSVGKDLKRARRRVNELEDALTERAQIEAELMTNNDELRDKVASLGRSYRRKLKQFIADMSDLSKALSEQADDAGDYVDEYGEGANTKRANERIQDMVDSLVEELVESHKAKEETTHAELDAIKAKNRAVLRRNQRLVTAYRELRIRVEDETDLAGVMEMVNEEEFQESDKTELERDLEEEVTKLTAKVKKLQHDVDTAQEDNLREIEAHQRVVYDLQARNAKVVGELETLRLMKATLSENGMSDDKLAALESQLLNKIDGMNAQRRPSSSLVREVDTLRRENESLRVNLESALASAAAAGGGAGGSGGPTESMAVLEMIETKSHISGGVGGGGGGVSSRTLEMLRQTLREFTSTTQARLERERSELLVRATVAEEQLESMQQYLATTTATYQNEIQRLRRELVLAGQPDHEAPPGRPAAAW